MVGLLSPLILRPFAPFTLSMPRPLTALSLGSGGINGWVPLVAGDAEGTLYAPRPNDPAPIGRVPGRVLALRCLGPLSFVVAYAPPVGDERVELWERDGEGSKRGASLGTLPAGAVPLLALGEGGIAVGSVGGRKAFLYDTAGRPRNDVALPEGVVGLAPWQEGADGGASLVAAFARGDAVAYGADGAIRWRHALSIRGRLLSFEASGERAAWVSDEVGDRVGIVDLASGNPVGGSWAASGALRAEALWSGQLLLVGDRTVEARRHAPRWVFGSPVVAADAGGENVAVALADGTLVVRNPLRAWVRKGNAALLSP